MFIYRMEEGCSHIIFYWGVDANDPYWLGIEFNVDGNKSALFVHNWVFNGYISAKAVDVDPNS